MAPSLTQDLCALRARHEIIGVTTFTQRTCAEDLPKVGDFVSINLEKVARLRPDAIVALRSQRMMLAPAERLGLPVHYFPDESYTDIFDDISMLGRLIGRSHGADALILSLRKQTRSLTRSVSFTRRPTVFVVVQAQPIWTAGSRSYISTLIALAGGRNVVHFTNQAYVEFNAEKLLQLQPDAIVGARDARLESFLGREPWRSLRAVRRGHVFIAADPALLFQADANYNATISWLVEHLRKAQ